MKQISLSIPTPCHENWEAMTPEDKGRFCASCQKTVIDFTAMSDREVAQFFKRPTGSVCGRFDGSQLDRVVEVPRKRLPWIKYFFGIALPALLFSKKVGAQGQVQTKGRVAVCDKPLTGAVAVVTPNDLKNDTVKPAKLPMGFVLGKMKVEMLKTLTSAIHNDKGEPISFASIMAKEEGRTVVADSMGMFFVKYIKLPLTLEISSIGYATQTFIYNGESNPVIVLKPAEYSHETLGIVIVAKIRKKKPANQPALFKKVELTPPTFSLYPNPINLNSALTIDPKTLEAGKYNLSIISSNGNVVQNGTITFEKAKTKQTINLQSVLTGVYFVRLTNASNAKSFTEKIIVQ